MNIDKIFNLFNNEEPESLKEKSQQADILLDYKNHPLFWVGRFKKLIQNHQTFNDQLLNFFDKLDEGLSAVDIDKAGEFLVFNRSYEYIQKVDPDNLVAQEALYRFADIHLKVALELSINYFQEHEEYEKCSHLKKNLEFVKLLLT
jgi:transcriptional regulator with PAS, ATPase and Fis domain